MSEQYRDNAILPVKISLTEGDFYTLWAPKWIAHGQEWQAFLGDEKDVFVFRSPADMLVFLESGTKHELQEHPRWNAFAARSEDRVLPVERDNYDIIGVPAQLAEKPKSQFVHATAGVFAVTRSLAEVADAEYARVFFASHSVLANAARGSEHFANNLSEWSAIGRAVLTNWAKVVESLDEVLKVIDVDAAASENAEKRISEAQAATQAAREQRAQAESEKSEQADPYDKSIWAATGIDPIKISIQGKTLYTLRTYLNANPVFLGRYGQIYTFNNKKSLVRWLVEHDKHDLASVSTWGDLMAKANAGELELEVHPDNVYSFNRLEESIEAGVNEVDTQQLGRAYELLADAADWAADDGLNSYFLANPRMQDYISYMLGSSQTSGYVPSAPFNQHAQSWHELEDMLIKRFSKF